MTSKICSGCEAELGIEEFHIQSGGKMGRNARCRTCISLSKQEAYAAKKKLLVTQLVDILPVEMIEEGILVETQIKHDKVVGRIKAKAKTTDKKYKELLKRIDILEKEQEAYSELSGSIDPYVITPALPDNTAEATAVLVLSDWHVAEKVDPDLINGLNKYDLEIAKDRAETCFRNGLKLLKIFQKDAKVENLVLPLLGDFISGAIHDELLENNLLLPIEETIFAQNLIASGIEFLLQDESIKKIIVPCHSGNHGRITKDRRITTEAGNSLEYMMYIQLENHFRGNPRVEFKVARGYHSYLEIYDKTLRFHHGHCVRYGGGIGGIMVPINKAIAQWNKLKHADIDVMGHYHQFLDGGNCISNGSLIGYNSFALSIKASYEEPKQAMFLIDKKRGKTIVAPILFNN